MLRSWALAFNSSAGAISFSSLAFVAILACFCPPASAGSLARLDACCEENECENAVNKGPQGNVGKNDQGGGHVVFTSK